MADEFFIYDKTVAENIFDANFLHMESERDKYSNTDLEFIPKIIYNSFIGNVSKIKTNVIINSKTFSNIKHILGNAQLFPLSLNREICNEELIKSAPYFGLNSIVSHLLFGIPFKELKFIVENEFEETVLNPLLTLLPQNHHSVTNFDIVFDRRKPTTSLDSGQIFFSFESSDINKKHSFQIPVYTSENNLNLFQVVVKFARQKFFIFDSSENNIPSFLLLSDELGILNGGGDDNNGGFSGVSSSLVCPPVSDSEKEEELFDLPFFHMTKRLTKEKLIRVPLDKFPIWFVNSQFDLKWIKHVLDTNSIHSFKNTNGRSTERKSSKLMKRNNRINDLCVREPIEIVNNFKLSEQFEKYEELKSEILKEFGIKTFLSNVYVNKKYVEIDPQTSYFISHISFRFKGGIDNAASETWFGKLPIVSIRLNGHFHGILNEAVLYYCLVKAYHKVLQDKELNYATTSSSSFPKREFSQHPRFNSLFEKMQIVKCTHETIKIVLRAYSLTHIQNIILQTFKYLIDDSSKIRYLESRSYFPFENQDANMPITCYLKCNVPQLSLLYFYPHCPTSACLVWEGGPSEKFMLAEYKKLSNNPKDNSALPKFGINKSDDLRCQEYMCNDSDPITLEDFKEILSIKEQYEVVVFKNHGYKLSSLRDLNENEKVPLFPLTREPALCGIENANLKAKGLIEHRNHIGLINALNVFSSSSPTTSYSSSSVERKQEERKSDNDMFKIKETNYLIFSNITHKITQEGIVYPLDVNDESIFSSPTNTFVTFDFPSGKGSSSSDGVFDDATVPNGGEAAATDTDDIVEKSPTSSPVFSSPSQFSTADDDDKSSYLITISSRNEKCKTSSDNEKSTIISFSIPIQPHDKAIETLVKVKECIEKKKDWFLPLWKIVHPLSAGVPVFNGIYSVLKPEIINKASFHHTCFDRERDFVMKWISSD
jgi:hypothetical protein